MTLTMNAQPGKLLGGIQFSTTSSLVVPVQTQLVPDAYVAHRAFHENVPGAFLFTHGLGQQSFPHEQIRTRWGMGLINVTDSEHTLNVMEIKGATGDRLTYVARCFDNVELTSIESDRWEPSAELTYEARGAFTVTQSARMVFVDKKGEVRVQKDGVSRIVVRAGVEMVRSLGDRYPIPLNGDGFSPNAMFEIACVAHASMEPVSNSNGDGSGWDESHSMTRIATSLGSTPAVVLKKIDDGMIEITNSVQLSPYGQRSAYSRFVVDLVRAAAAMRPDTFPLSQ